jgi:hypothetical protein
MAIASVRCRHLRIEPKHRYSDVSRWGRGFRAAMSCRTSGAVVDMKPHVVSLSANWYAASPNITCLPVVAPLVLHETRLLSSLDRFSPRTIVATPSVSCATATPVSRHRERYSSRRSRKNVADLTMPRHSVCHVSGRPRTDRPERMDGPAPQGATGRTDRRKRGSGQTPGRLQVGGGPVPFAPCRQGAYKFSQGVCTA